MIGCAVAILPEILNRPELVGIFNRVTCAVTRIASIFRNIVCNALSRLARISEKSMVTFILAEVAGAAFFGEASSIDLSHFHFGKDFIDFAGGVGHVLKKTGSHADQADN